MADDHVTFLAHDRRKARTSRTEQHTLNIVHRSWYLNILPCLRYIQDNPSRPLILLQKCMCSKPMQAPPACQPPHTPRHQPRPPHPLNCFGLLELNSHCVSRTCSIELQEVIGQASSLVTCTSPCNIKFTSPRVLVLV